MIDGIGAIAFPLPVAAATGHFAIVVAGPSPRILQRRGRDPARLPAGDRAPPRAARDRRARGRGRGSTGILTQAACPPVAMRPGIALRTDARTRA